MERRGFGRLADGRSVEKVILKNGNGITGEFINYGCRITDLRVPDRKGNFESVVLGHDTPAEYEVPGDVLGAVIGRFANRIAGAEVTVGGRPCHLTKNEGENTLHSAASGFQNRLWQIAKVVEGREPSVTFSMESPDGDGGFPGNLRVEVTYTLASGNALRIDYRAETDARTPLNLTNHSFFNLSGHAEQDVLGMTMRIFADEITESDSGLIPTGRILPVGGTPYDFHSAKPIGRDIVSSDPQMRRCGGYDVNYVLNGPDKLKKAAELFDPASGRLMRVFTDLPGLQFYTANSFPAGALGRGWVELKPHHAVCLETQYFPDSPHRPEFPYHDLLPGSVFQSTTVYQFDCL